MSRRPTFDENQLSLFSEATEAAPINPDTVVLESLDERNKRHDATGLQNPGHTGSAIARRWCGTLERANQLQQAVFAAQELTGNLLYELTVVQKMDYQIGLGDRDEGVGVPSGRGRSTPAIIRSGDSRPASTLARDLRLTSAHGIGAGRSQGESPRQPRGHPYPEIGRGSKPRRDCRRA